MAERRQCEFSLVRYVPDRVKSEFVNIGVLLRAQGEETAEVRFTRDWSRVRCLDPDADIAMLEALEGEIRARMAEGGERLLRAVEDSFSNAVQLTGAKGYLAESLPAGVEQLLKMYVEPQKRAKSARQSGRQGIYNSMRRSFEQAGVWELMRKRIAAAAYTRPGDSLRLDCGYRPNGMIRMFHAVSLAGGDVEAAKVLAFTAPALRDGVARVEGARLELTAIVEPLKAIGDEGERVAQYRFAVETMEEREIRVMVTGDLPRLAEAARRELRV